jgi:hypothetical protein
MKMTAYFRKPCIHKFEANNLLSLQAAIIMKPLFI